MDEIDRVLLHDDKVRVSARFAENVMAEIRAEARPVPSAFPWRDVLVKSAAVAALAVTAITMSAYMDLTAFAPVARELTGAGALLAGGLAAIYLPRLSADAWE